MKKNLSEEWAGTEEAEAALAEIADRGCYHVLRADGVAEAFIVFVVTVLDGDRVCFALLDSSLQSCHEVAHADRPSLSHGVVLMPVAVAGTRHFVGVGGDVYLAGS